MTPRITKDQVCLAPWRYSVGQWLSVHDVHQPYLAEISPMQYGLLSERQRRAYDAKREIEWTAAGAAKDAYQLVILMAEAAGLFLERDPDVSPDARAIITQARLEQARMVRARILEQMHAENRAVTLDDLHPDMWMAASVGGWVRIVKCNRTTVRVEWERGAFMNYHPSTLRWLDYADVEAALDAGMGVRIYHERIAPARAWKAAETDVALPRTDG